MAMEILAEGLTGGIGGFMGRIVSFPFDTLKVKLATEANGGVSTLVRRIVREEGILGFYQGLQFSAFEALQQKFLYVVAFTYLKRLARRLVGRDSVPATVLCGYFSDLTCVPFSMPMEAMVVQLQSAKPGQSRAAIVRKALTLEGIITSVKTGRAYLVLSFKAGLEFAIFERVKTMILKGKTRLHNGTDLVPVVAFLLGAVARGLATMVTYPYARGKALCQAKLAPTAYDGVKQVFHTEGPLALYRGMGMEVSRGMTQSAVMFAVMERIRAVVRRLLLEQPGAGR